uniref:Rab11 family-interacting protein 1 n=1 Tax=Phallusia mammillata TaxID=59560 RepID=A0A6F9DPI7_9ASCI|nr:rab11 family-interacting protein 1 [Phallusia mammillata]
MWSPTDIVVTVKQARNLLVKGKNGVNDAYATIELGKEKFATSPERSNSPSWLTECSFSLPQGGVLNNKCVVFINVYHKRHGKLGLESDEFIGQAQIPLSALNCNDNKQRSRWYTLGSKKKDNKKERGEVEVGFKFLTLNRSGVLPDKKESPKPLRLLTTGLRGKFRRRSEDEDSGVGFGDAERFSPLGMGRSLENLSTISNSPTGTFERSFHTSSTTSSPGVLTSARGSARNLQSHQLGSAKAVSVDVLNKPPMPRISSSLSRSNSGGSSDKGHGSAMKQHVRNRSMPNAQLKTVMGQLHPSKSDVCINGNHLYVPGTQESSGCSSSSSPEFNRRTGSFTNLNESSSSSSLPNPRIKSSNNNSNTTKRHSIADINITNPRQKIAPLPNLYKPKNYYRLDVKELRKVSTIHEDSSTNFHTMSHEQLVKLATKQQAEIADRNQHLRELEDYIDSLLLRVMVCTPQILDQTFDIVGKQDRRF